MTVRQLLAEISAGELVEWMAYARLEPFGCPAEDYRAGIGVSMFYNAHRSKQEPAAGPLDFIPWAEGGKPEDKVQTLSPEETSRAIAAWLGKADYK